MNDKGEYRMKYALIGCGRISTNHIKAAINNKLDIVAVCDIDGAHMQSNKIPGTLISSFFTKIYLMEQGHNHPLKKDYIW